MESWGNFADRWIVVFFYNDKSGGMFCFLIKEVECSSVLSYWELLIRKDLCLSFGIGTMIKLVGHC